MAEKYVGITIEVKQDGIAVIDQAGQKFEALAGKVRQSRETVDGFGYSLKPIPSVVNEAGDSFGKFSKQAGLASGGLHALSAAGVPIPSELFEAAASAQGLSAKLASTAPEGVSAGAALSTMGGAAAAAAIAALPLTVVIVTLTAVAHALGSKFYELYNDEKDLAESIKSHDAYYTNVDRQFEDLAKTLGTTDEVLKRFGATEDEAFLKLMKIAKENPHGLIAAAVRDLSAARLEAKAVSDQLDAIAWEKEMPSEQFLKGINDQFGATVGIMRALPEELAKVAESTGSAEAGTRRYGDAFMQAYEKARKLGAYIPESMKQQAEAIHVAQAAIREADYGGDRIEGIRTQFEDVGIAMRKLPGLLQEATEKTGNATAAAMGLAGEFNSTYENAKRLGLTLSSEFMTALRLAQSLTETYEEWSAKWKKITEERVANQGKGLAIIVAAEKAAQDAITADYEAAWNKRKGFSVSTDLTQEDDTIVGPNAAASKLAKGLGNSALTSAVKSGNVSAVERTLAGSRAMRDQAQQTGIAGIHAGEFNAKASEEISALEKIIAALKGGSDGGGSPASERAATRMEAAAASIAATFSGGIKVTDSGMRVIGETVFGQKARGV